MVSVLINFLISVISSISSAIISPFISSVFALFPDLTDKLQYFNYILALMLQYVGTFMKLLLIDDTMIAFIFGFIIIRFSIYIIVSGVRFILKAYNYLKP